MYLFRVRDELAEATSNPTAGNGLAYSINSVNINATHAGGLGRVPNCLPNFGTPSFVLITLSAVVISLCCLPAAIRCLLDYAPYHDLRFGFRTDNQPYGLLAIVMNSPIIMLIASLTAPTRHRCSPGRGPSHRKPSVGNIVSSRSCITRGFGASFAHSSANRYC